MIEFKMLSLVALLAIALVCLGYVLRKSRDKSNPIDLDDLLLETGPNGKQRVSKTAAFAWIALLTSVWVLVNKTLQGANIDTIYTAFMAVWAAPIVASILKNKVGVEGEDK